MKKLSIILLTTILLIACKKENNVCSGEECTYSLASNETSGTVPGAVQGVYDLSAQYDTGNSPYPDGTTGKFTIEGDKLTIEIDGHACITLINGYQTSPSEVVFTDNCRDNLKYAVSESNSGGLNEVNVVSLSGVFYSQFKE